MKINAPTFVDTPLRLSDALLLRSAIGDGVKSPHRDYHYMVFSVAARDAAVTALYDAERALVSGDPAIKSRPSHCDTSAARGDLINLLAASKYAALSFLDVRGCKLAASSVNRSSLIKYLGWVDISWMAERLRQPVSAEPMKFIHFSGLKAERLDTLRRSSLGGSVLIPGAASSSCASFGSSTALQLLRRYFVAGGATSSRIKTQFESEEVRLEWQALLEAGAEAFYDGNLTAHHLRAASTMAAPVSLLLGAAADAALVNACIDSLAATVVVIRSEHLDLAKEYATYLFNSNSGFDRLQRRNEQHLKALASFSTPEKIAKAEQALYDAITLSPHRKISHEAAIRTPGITAGLLKILTTQEGKFSLLSGVENIRMGKTAIAYTLNTTAP